MMKRRLLVAVLLLVACSMGCRGTQRDILLPHGAREDTAKSGDGRAVHDAVLLREVLTHGPTIEALVRSTMTTVLVATGWMYKMMHGKVPGLDGSSRRGLQQGRRQGEEASTLHGILTSNIATTEQNSTSTARQTTETEVSTSHTARSGWEYENEPPEYNPNSWSVFGRMVSPQASPAPPEQDDEPGVPGMPVLAEMPPKAAANLNMWSSFGRRSAADRIPERTRDGSPVRSSSVNPAFFLTPFGDQTDKQRSIEERQVKQTGDAAASHKRTPDPRVYPPNARPTLQPDWTKIPFFG
uniref:Uncharacterized protein n=1 Tax=Branchiostoma floridae TaxID=7739 RepID=C3Y6A5_BRAFL|eukprot:XP_002608492.1 hypothetical protein BRAFLDRAFT_96628 [Branchiostoma floridae]